MDNKEIGKRISELRKKNNITQVQLAEKLGVSKGTVAMWETGKRQPNFETLDELSDIFDKRIDYILGRSNDETSPNLVEADIDQLGRWEIEESFREFFMDYFSLDAFGKRNVENLVKSEKLRCREQQSLCNTDNIVVKVLVSSENK